MTDGCLSCHPSKNLLIVIGKVKYATADFQFFYVPWEFHCRKNGGQSKEKQRETQVLFDDTALSVNEEHFTTLTVV